jgi:anti-sigma regulatory factor (Ser/Thr protein kinase)
MGFGAGMGLPNMKNVSDAFDIQSSPKGTTITMSFAEAAK